MIAADRRQRQCERRRDRLDALAQRRWRREAELVVVAAGEHASERQLAFGARELVASAAERGIAARSTTAPTRDAART